MPHDLANNNRNVFNLRILKLKDRDVRNMFPIRSLNIFTSSTNNFHPNGLFSTEIFGVSGDPTRATTLAYINTHARILHPLIYQHLKSIKKFYHQIMRGETYVLFDEKLGDFVLSDIKYGHTGYTYFLNNVDKLKLDNKDSQQRTIKINMIEKYANKDSCITNLLVLPAGLRDYYVDESGRAKEDEINDLYRRIIMLSNGLSEVSDSGVTILDPMLMLLQTSLDDLYEHLRSLLDGKNKFIQGSWTKRGVTFGTRSVITPYLPNITNINEPNRINQDYSVCGLYQYANAIIPVTIHNVIKHFSSKVMSPTSTMVSVFNPETNISELVNVSVKERDSWLTSSGIIKKLTVMKYDHYRSDIVTINNKPMVLLHESDNIITPIFNSNDISDDMAAKDIRPITYYELFYISLLDTMGKYPALFTRFPATQEGSMYPSSLTAVTTIISKKVTVRLDGVEIMADSYPIYGNEYANGLSIHPSHLETTGGDFDGDQMGLNSLMTKESIAEVEDVINAKSTYINTSGEAIYNPVSSTLEYVVKSMATT